MTTETYDDLQAELGDTDLGARGEYDKKPRPPSLPFYKIWNVNPKDPDAVRTPGVVMTKYNGKDTPKEVEVVPSVRAVILYKSHARKLGTWSEKEKRTDVKCCSFDGVEPAVRIKAPLCRKATSADVAAIISQWRGYDAAKIEAVTKEVTEGTGNLQVCGLKAGTGFISLCPYSKKDPVTGAFASCKQSIHVFGYDIERKRLFRMELSGQSIYDNNKFRSPFHQFYQFLNDNGKEKPLLSYQFHIELSPAQNGAMYYLNLQNYTKIAQADNRAQMLELAEKAKGDYLEESCRVFEEEKKVTLPTKEEAPPLKDSLPDPVSFEDDELNF